MAILATLTMGVAREVINQANIKQTKTALLILRNQVDKYKDQFRTYPAGAGSPGATELIAAIQQMGNNPQSIVGAQACPNNTYFQDAWGNKIEYLYNSSGSIGGNYDTLFKQNNCTPLYISPGPNGTFDGGGDDVTVP